MPQQPPPPLSQAETNEVADLKQQFTEPYRWFGNALPEPVPGETPHRYRARLVAGLGIQPGATAGAYATLSPNALRHMAAEHVARAPAVAHALAAERGEMRAVRRDDAAGRTVVEFIGDPDVWMDQFKGPRFLGSINVNVGKKWVEGHWE